MWISMVFRARHPVAREGPLGRFLGAGLAGRLGSSFGGLAANDLVTQLAVGNFVQSDIHEGHTRTDDDHGAVTKTKLPDAFRDNVDQDLGVGDLGKGAMDKF